MSDIIDRIRDTETMPLRSVAARADAQNILQEAREEIARLRLTDAEREAVKFALSRLEWPLDGPQMAVVAHAAGPTCEVPEHGMKATLRGLLERTKGGGE